MDGIYSLGSQVLSPTPEASHQDIGMREGVARHELSSKRGQIYF